MTRSTASSGWSGGESLTPIQQALVSFGDALTAASTDARTLRIFLDCVSIRVASEYARRLDHLDDEVSA